MEILDEDIGPNSFEECKPLLWKNFNLGLVGVITLGAMSFMLCYQHWKNYHWEWGFLPLSIFGPLLFLLMFGFVFLLWMEYVRDLRSKKVIVSQTSIRTKKINYTRKSPTYLVAFEKLEGKTGLNSIEKDLYEQLELGDQVLVYLSGHSNSFLKVKKLNKE